MSKATLIICCKPQQAGNQSPVITNAVTPRNITAEGNAVTTTAFSGSALKTVAPGPYSGYSASTPRGVHTEGENQVLHVVADSPTLSSGTHHGASSGTATLNISRKVITPADGLSRGDGCLRADGTVDGTTSVASAPTLVPIHKDTSLVSTWVWGI